MDEWGFRKYVSRSERLKILEALPRDSDDAVPNLKDRRLKPGKLKNWRRRYRGEVTGALLSLSQRSRGQGKCTMFLSRTVTKDVVQQQPVNPLSTLVIQKLKYIKPQTLKRTPVLSLSMALARISTRIQQRRRLIPFPWRYAKRLGLSTGPQSTLLILLGCHAFSRVAKSNARLVFHLCLSIHPILKTRHVCPPWRFRNYPKIAARKRLTIPTQSNHSKPGDASYRWRRIQISTHTILGAMSTLSFAGIIRIP
jgi:hypothetical protein